MAYKLPAALWRGWSLAQPFDTLFFLHHKSNYEVSGPSEEEKLWEKSGKTDADIFDANHRLA